MSILKINNISKQFDGIKALSEVTFDVPDGKVVALIGPNGAGKTTLFNIINGFIQPDCGDILFKDTNITKTPTHKISKLGISRSFQNIRLFPQLTVLENILLALNYGELENLFSAIVKRKSILYEDIKNTKKALEYLEIVRMAHKKDSLSENLSHGQKRLVSIARSLALNPSLILLDEPMSGVFPDTISELKKIITSLADDGKTILFIEHNMKVVMDIADWIIVLNYGKKIAEDIPENIKNNQDVINAYLGKSLNNVT